MILSTDAILSILRDIFLITNGAAELVPINLFAHIIC